MDDLFETAEAALTTLVGGEADFRDDQWEAIEALVETARRVLVVQRTGWGKSAVYFVATAAAARRGARARRCSSRRCSRLCATRSTPAERGGVRTGRITSDNRDEWEQIVDELERDEVDVLLVSPERFANPRSATTCCRRSPTRRACS